MAGKKSQSKMKRRSWALDYVASRECMPNEVYEVTQGRLMAALKLIGSVDINGFIERTEAALELATDRQSIDSARIFIAIAKGFRSSKRAAEFGILENESQNEGEIILPN